MAFNPSPNHPLLPMCVISCVVSPTAGVNPELIYCMNAVAAHRGPDDEGVYVCDKVGLGHRRLSILDLGLRGHQPLHYQDRLVITHNGEIYNHTELREELSHLGHTFATLTDTEVIAASYLEWGRQCLNKFNGMWAFVIFDRATHRLFIARDRFGVKPLYYWQSPSGFIAIASEIKQFTVLPGWQPKLNGQRARDFLSWGISDHTPETLFAGVNQIRGGEYIEVAVNEGMHGIHTNRWYDLKPAPWDGSFPDASDRFRELLEDSVRLRLRADVPVGFCLSGGLDSSSIACVANLLLKPPKVSHRPHAFSARSAISAFDEGDYIREVILSTGITAHEVTPIIDEVFEALPQITWHQDEPFGSTSIYAQWKVFQLGNQHGIKVLLDGQGADEVLAGYHGFFGPRLVGLLLEGKLRNFINEARSIGKAHGYSALDITKRIVDVISPPLLRQIFRRAVRQPSNFDGGLFDWKRVGAVPNDPFLTAGARSHALEKFSEAQILRVGLPMLLRWEDRNSMAHGIESRTPFLDYRLVEFALGLPSNFKLCGRITKRILRVSMSGILPDRVRQRLDKKGFATAEEHWLRVDAPERFRGALEDAIECSQGLINPTALKYLDNVISGKYPFSFLPWRMISFGAWMERFGVQL